MRAVLLAAAALTVAQCTWNTYDPNAPYDASVPPANHMIPCGMGPCDPTPTTGTAQACCIPKGSGGPSCQGFGTCSGTEVQCTDSSTCSAGQACCIKLGGKGWVVGCVASSLCNTDNTVCGGNYSGCGCQMLQGNCRLSISVCGNTNRPEVCNPL